MKSHDFSLGYGYNGKKRPIIVTLRFWVKIILILLVGGDLNWQYVATYYIMLPKARIAAIMWTQVHNALA